MKNDLLIKLESIWWHKAPATYAYMGKPKHLKEEIIASGLELHLSLLVRAPKAIKSRKRKWGKHFLGY